MKNIKCLNIVKYFSFVFLIYDKNQQKKNYRKIVGSLRSITGISKIRETKKQLNTGHLIAKQRNIKKLKKL